MTPPPLAVYVHVPWCLQRCPYCDFATVAISPRDIPHRAYGEAVRTELRLRAGEFRGHAVATVFFGGGTPSLWDPAEIASVIADVRDAFGPPREVTVECNPTSLDASRAAALAEAGVTRVSIGVQSLADADLRFLGRLHDADGARAAVRAATAHGGLAVSADLMFGTPTQDRARLCEHVDELVSLGVGHVSAYSLTIEPATRFGELARQGRLPRLPDDAVADVYLSIEHRLRDHGFEHYEVSNYALPGAASEHNAAYWRGEAYLGLGSGAVGCAPARDGHAVRYRNLADTAEYIAQLATHQLPPHETEELGSQTLVREGLMLGLRTTAGVDLPALERRARVDPREGRERAIARQIALGNVEDDGPRMRIPRERWLLADEIVTQLF